MITLNGIRNSIWCTLAFSIVACAATPLSTARPSAAQGELTTLQGNHLVGIIAASNDQAIPGRQAVGAP
jgi:hypothetical protein